MRRSKEDELLKQRIEKILQKTGTDLSQKSILQYKKYLKKSLHLPCEAVSMDYSSGRKMTINRILQNPHMEEDEQGVIVEVDTERGTQEWPLADLETLTKKDPNSALMNDYSVWIVNEGYL